MEIDVEVWKIYESAGFLDSFSHLISEVDRGQK
jgi:hypothetical protein